MYYYINSAGQQTGPVPADQLAANGVTANTLVWKDGMNEWTKASAVPELRFLFDPTVPPPAPTNSTNTANLLDNLLQYNIFTLLVGIVGVIIVLYWFFCAKNNWVWLFWGILAGSLYWFWKDLIGKKNPKKSNIWTIIIAIILGSCCNNSKLVYSEKDVEKLVKGTTWSVTDKTVKGYKGLWLKYELKKDHTAIVYYANPSEGKWTRFTGSSTWKTISGRFSDTGNEYYGVEINLGANKIIFQDGEAVLYWADQEPTLIEEGDNAPW